MNIGIIGAGSVGLLMAAYLGRDHKVSLYVRRKDQKDCLEAEGVYCDQTKGNVPVHVHLLGETSADHDLVFVTVKQHGLEQVLEVLPPWNQDTPIIFLQNGMSHLDQLPVRDFRCWVGVVEHGAMKASDHFVKHTGSGMIKLATLQTDDKLELIVSSLCEQDFWFESCVDYFDMLSNKLIINTVINPLTALLRLKNGAIYDNPYVQGLARQLCQEACTVLHKSIDEEWPRVLSVAANTGQNESSMFKDLVHKRKTEVEAINGYIVNKSAQPLPIHEFVIQGIQAIELDHGVRL